MPLLDQRSTRRHFVLGAGAVGLGLLTRSAAARPLPPSERIRVAMIGVGGQGMNNLRAFRTNVVALADVDSSRLSIAKRLADVLTGASCTPVADFRRLLDRKDIDAVVVSTPDHWHALATTLALQAGKDVYCEKPLSLTVAEGRAMVNSARRYGRVVQTGSQQRSDPRFRLACELVRSGAIGAVRSVEVGLPGVNFDGPPVPDTPPPAVLDYPFWLGPAPDRPYNAKRVHYNFRFFWDYSGGQLTNWGAHHLDIVQWGLGMDGSGPTEVAGTALFDPRGWYEVPQSFELTYTYPGGIVVSCGSRHRLGVRFVGARGSIFVTRGRLESDPAEVVGSPRVTEHLRESKGHAADWLDCIRSREAPICEAAIGHRSATVCHLGNIALRTGRTIHWNPVREAIADDPEASAMLTRPYRAPWSLRDNA